MNEELSNRIALLTRLVKESPGRDLGRTAIMKLAYFLTILRDVPLGYRFTLYSYGPFDSTVLQDVNFASNFGALLSRPISFPTGTGYSIQPGAASDEIEAWGHEFVAAHLDDIRWVVNEFANLTAADLELASTIIYIDRESNASVTRSELAKKVRDVKPHFSNDRILSSIEMLEQKHLLTSSN